VSIKTLVGATREEILAEINNTSRALKELGYTVEENDIKNWVNLDEDNGGTYLYIEFEVDGKKYYSTERIQIIDPDKVYLSDGNYGYKQIQDAPPMYEYEDGQGNDILTDVYSVSYYTDSDGVRYDTNWYTVYQTANGDKYIYAESVINGSVRFGYYYDADDNRVVYYEVYDYNTYTRIYYDEAGNQIDAPEGYSGGWNAYVKVTFDADGRLTRDGNLFYTTNGGYATSINYTSSAYYYKQTDGDLLKKESELTYHKDYYYYEAIPVTIIDAYYVDGNGDTVEEQIHSTSYYYTDSDGIRYNTSYIVYQTANGDKYISAESVINGSVYFYYYYVDGNKVGFYSVFDYNTYKYTYYDEAGNIIDKPESYYYGYWRNAYVKVTFDEDGRLTRVDNLFYTRESGYATSFNYTNDTYYYKQVDGDLFKNGSELTYRTDYYYNEQHILNDGFEFDYAKVSIYSYNRLEVYFTYSYSYEYLSNVQYYGLDINNGYANVELSQTDSDGTKYFIYYVIGDSRFGKVATARIVVAR
jgi:hypothetical protein